MKQETKFCSICKLGIDNTKQFAEFIHWVNKNKIQSQAYYHIECYKERMLGSAKGQYLMARANKLLEKAEGLMPQ